ncbi:MAG: ABC transporter ATP-binding protein [Pontiellaceae bacterium]|nr:ABC transporter ATP-binding protein [Pontiellaceae bacterium]
MSEQLLELENVTKRYGAETEVLRGIDLTVAAGERIAIVGASGCGKSTLLNLIGAMDQPDAGSILFEGTDIATLSEKEAAAFRNAQVGFVFQLHHLLPQCSVLENAMVPALANPGKKEVRERALHLLERVGLTHRLTHRPGQLSGGERQRVAVVRALINQPRLLLADEPTGALNQAAADDLMALLLELNREENLSLVMVTHSMRLAEQLDRVSTLENGILK